MQTTIQQQQHLLELDKNLKAWQRQRLAKEKFERDLEVLRQWTEAINDMNLRRGVG